MNAKLFEKVKSLCKDTGLSEKYLKAITAKLGGSIEDDSTDEAAIEEAANLVAEVAKESQGEATRWANAKGKGKKKPSKDDDPDEDDPEDDPDEDDDSSRGKGKRKQKKDEDPTEARLKALEEQLAKYKADEAKGKRSKEISEAFEKHKIPTYLRDRLAKSISDDEDLEEAVSALKQDLITNGLISEGSEGAKAASEKQVEEAANSLLESITAK